MRFLLALVLCPGAVASAANVIVNGGFESGNTGFSTAHLFSPGSNTNEGQYTIRSNPAGWNGSFLSTADHTTGTGLMMVVNGQDVSTPILLWGQTVTVTPGRTYSFSMWVRTVVNGTSANLLVTINGQDLSPSFVAPTQHSAGWVSFTRSWIAGSSPASVSIKNLNIATFPNDFVIDDIALEAALCPGDLNGDGQVDDADFSIFVFAYDILDCADPIMPAGCPADLNGDGLVEDADFSVFVVAYDALLCP